MKTSWQSKHLWVSVTIKWCWQEFPCHVNTAWNTLTSGTNSSCEYWKKDLPRLFVRSVSPVLKWLTGPLLVKQQTGVTEPLLMFVITPLYRLWIEERKKKALKIMFHVRKICSESKNNIRHRWLQMTRKPKDVNVTNRNVCAWQKLEIQIRDRIVGRVQHMEERRGRRNEWGKGQQEGSQRSYYTWCNKQVWESTNM